MVNETRRLVTSRHTAVSQCSLSTLATDMCHFLEKLAQNFTGGIGTVLLFDRTVSGVLSLPAIALPIMQLLPE